MSLTADSILFALQTVIVFGALGAALALVVVAHRRPGTIVLAIAAGLVVVAFVIVVVSPLNSPQPAGIVLALLGLAVAVVGGDPVARRVLHVATGGRVRETADGGIVVADGAGDTRHRAQDVVLLRGGTTIGYLERIAAALAIIAGFPEALAAIVAVKGIGRFSELASSEARERFIIGTLASLVWACAVGGTVRLAIW